MNYSPLIDIALLGTALLLVVIIIAKEPKAKRGAVSMDRGRIRMMQRIRRLENESL